MLKDAVSTKATGGGGYTFADKVAAGFLATILRRKLPLDPELGQIIALDFETRDAGNVLDDLLLILQRGQEQTRCPVSVKSNRQLTKVGFNAEFVRDAWDQWNGGPSSDFDPARDILGLIVGIIDEPTLNEWQELRKEAASTTPNRLVKRLQNGGQLSASQRKIFESLRRISDVAERDAEETARLVARLHILRFSDYSEGDSINIAQRSFVMEIWQRARNSGGVYFSLLRKTGLQAVISIYRSLFVFCGQILLLKTTQISEVIGSNSKPSAPRTCRQCAV
jgi:hypothetical protein